MTIAKPKVAFLAGPRYGPTSGPRWVSQAPPDLDVLIVDAALPEEEKIRLCTDVEAIIVVDETVDFDFLRSCHNVKLVQSASAGNEMLDLVPWARWAYLWRTMGAPTPTPWPRKPSDL